MKPPSKLELPPIINSHLSDEDLEQIKAEGRKEAAYARRRERMQKEHQRGEHKDEVKAFRPVPQCFTCLCSVNDVANNVGHLARFMVKRETPRGFRK